MIADYEKRIQDSVMTEIDQFVRIEFLKDGKLLATDKAYSPVFSDEGGELVFVSKFDFFTMDKQPLFVPLAVMNLPSGAHDITVKTVLVEENGNAIKRVDSIVENVKINKPEITFFTVDLEQAKITMLGPNSRRWDFAVFGTGEPDPYIVLSLSKRIYAYTNFIENRLELSKEKGDKVSLTIPVSVGDRVIIEINDHDSNFLNDDDVIARWKINTAELENDRAYFLEGNQEYLEQYKISYKNSVDMQ